MDANEFQSIKQGSSEWMAQRCGRVTASRVADVIAKTKTGYSTSRENYMAQLICERLTGTPTEGFTNAAMQWGTETESKARAAYEATTFTSVREVAMISHPSIPNTGASPDGLIGEDGLIEIKCPNTATHLDTLLSQKVPGKYVTQMQWQMACTGRQWCDFVSFDPRLPEHLQLFVKRVSRDNDFIKQTEDEIVAFLLELEQKIESLNKLDKSNG
jgi:putative phage-type endonuclease